MAQQVITVPKWTLALRGLQLLFAIVILGLSAYGVYWISFNSWGFAIFTSLATVIIVLYGFLTVHLNPVKPFYNYWAILALDALAAIFWLSAMAALASTRSAFKYPTTITECVNFGSGGVCTRSLSKRYFVAGTGYLAMMSAAAGLSALNMLLFIATLAIFGLALKKQRNHTTAGEAETTNDKVESHPMAPQGYEQAPQQQQQAPHQQQQYPEQYQQQQQQQQGYPPQQQYAPVSPQSDYVQPYPQQHQAQAHPEQSELYASQYVQPQQQQHGGGVPVEKPS